MTSPTGGNASLWGFEMNTNSRERRLHQVEVGTLSRQGIDPYATHYRQPFAFSTIPYPLIRQVALRLPCHHACACWRIVGLTTFPDLPTLAGRPLPVYPFRTHLSWGCTNGDETLIYTGISDSVPFGYGLSAD